MVFLAHIAGTAPTPAPAAEDGQQAAGTGGAAAQQQQGQQQRLSDYVLPACDSKALCAYLDLFRRAPCSVLLQCRHAWGLRCSAEKRTDQSHSSACRNPQVSACWSAAALAAGG